MSKGIIYHPLALQFPEWLVLMIIFNHNQLLIMIFVTNDIIFNWGLKAIWSELNCRVMSNRAGNIWHTNLTGEKNPSFCYKLIEVCNVECAFKIKLLFENKGPIFLQTILSPVQAQRAFIDPVFLHFLQR